MVSPLHELWYVLPNQNFDWRTLYKETLERLLVTLQIWLLGFAWIHDCHNCLLVMKVAGVFWVVKKVSIFNSSILSTYFSSCFSLSATQDCWFNQFPGQQYFAQWELQLMILFWMNMNLFKRKQYIVFCIEKSIVKKTIFTYLHKILQYPVCSRLYVCIQRGYRNIDDGKWMP